MVFRVGRCDPEFGSAASLNSLDFHQLSHRVDGTVRSLFDQFAMDARTAVILVARQAMNAFNFGHDLFLFLLGWGSYAAEPLVSERTVTEVRFSLPIP